ncbi:Sensor domain-containing protein OS=Streptomyces alboniger OX=132473 GN=CP975_01290 PE=4 SV=1 [Streptomyces alboniger]
MRTSTRIDKGLFAAAAVVVAAAGVAAGTVPAAAAGTPRFLAPSQLPPHATSAWTAGPVTAGQPDPLPMCVGEAFPSTSVHRAYRTDLDTGALQVTVVERDERRAKEYAALLRTKLDGCAEKVMAENPDITAEQKYYGKLNVEEGAHVYGVHTNASWGASDINMFSVGRDGSTVTLVQWGQMGGFADAQVADFKKTTVTAVNRLH